MLFRHLSIYHFLLKYVFILFVAITQLLIYLHLYTYLLYSCVFCERRDRVHFLAALELGQCLINRKYTAHTHCINSG